MCQQLFQGPPASQWENIGQKPSFPNAITFRLNTKVSKHRIEKPNNFVFHPP